MVYHSLGRKETEISENEVLRKEEIRGGWRKLVNEELYNFHLLQKKNEMGWICNILGAVQSFGWQPSTERPTWKN
jgi:hypothetical protein